MAVARQRDLIIAWANEYIRDYASDEKVFQFGDGEPPIRVAFGERPSPFSPKYMMDKTYEGDLTEVPPEDRPPVAPVFFSFRVMVGIGMLFIALAATGLVLLLLGRLFAYPLYLKALIAASPLGFFAVIAGWVTTEIGRQPWVVAGLMRTADSGSATVQTSEVATSLALFSVVYLLLLLVFIGVILGLIRKGPTTGPEPWTRLKTPAGMPASSTISAKRIADKGDNSLGFRMTVQPAASAGPTLAVI